MTDLFDEAPSGPAAPRTAAVSPLTTANEDDVYDGYVALRWRAAGLALVAAAAVALVMHFPGWAVAGAALLAAGTSLWPLPRRPARFRAVVVCSFFFAQVTSVFVNQPFAWPMRFVFCFVLLAVPVLIVGRDLD